MHQYLHQFFFGEEFRAAGNIIRYLSVTTLFVSVANVIRTQYLIPNEKDRSYIISVAIGAVINLIFNTLLIPKYQAMGAVVGTIIAEFSVMLYQIIDVRKELEIVKYIKENLIYLLLGIIMFVAVISIKPLIENEMVLLILQILLGVVIYVGGFMIIQMVQLKEKNIFKLYKKIRVKYNI